MLFYIRAFLYPFLLLKCFESGFWLFLIANIRAKIQMYVSCFVKLIWKIKSERGRLLEGYNQHHFNTCLARGWGMVVISSLLVCDTILSISYIHCMSYVIFTERLISLYFGLHDNKRICTLWASWYSYHAVCKWYIHVWIYTMSYKSSVQNVQWKAWFWHLGIELYWSMVASLMSNKLVTFLLVEHDTSRYVFCIIYLGRMSKTKFPYGIWGWLQDYFMEMTNVSRIL